MHRLTLGLAVLVACAAPAHAALITIGTNTASNSFPFGNNDSTYTGEYQEIYTNTAFSGPVTITSVAFATASSSVGGTGTVGFTLSLSTTPLANLASPSTNYASNRGADFTQVFSGSKTINALGNGTFDLVSATNPFVYDPSKGALLLDVNITSPETNSTIYFEGNTDATTSRVYNNSVNGAPTVGMPPSTSGLVTQFTVTPNAVPEPASLGLLGLGLAGSWAARRRALARRA